MRGIMAAEALLVGGLVIGAALDAEAASTFKMCSASDARGQGCVVWYLSTNKAGAQVVRPHTCSFQRNVPDLQTVYFEAYGAMGHGANKTFNGVYATSNPTVTWDCGPTFTSWAYQSPGAWFRMDVTGYPGGHTGQESYYVYS